MTEKRIAEVFSAMVQAGQRLSVKAFAERAGVAPSTLYHLYPEWADKIRVHRDENRKVPRILSPRARKQKKGEEAEAYSLIERLRSEVITAQAELEALRKDRDRWKRAAEENEEHRKTNERLRGVLQKLSDILRKHVDSRTAQAILIELNQFQERHLYRV